MAEGRTRSSQGPRPLSSRSPEGRHEAPPGLSPLDLVPLETTPRRRRQDEGRWRSGLDRYPCPTSPGSRLRIPRYWLGAACTIEFGIRKSKCDKGILWVTLVSEYLRSPQGLGPGQPLVFAYVGGGGVVRKESPSLLGPSGLPSWGGLPFLVSPVGGGASSSSSSYSGEECTAESSDGESDDAWRRELFRAPLAFLVFSGTV